MNNLDPETINGDYAEAYQRWTHYFNKNNESIEECFKETAYVPFEPFYDPEFVTPNWDSLAKSIKKHLEKEND